MTTNTEAVGWSLFACDSAVARSRRVDRERPRRGRDLGRRNYDDGMSGKDSQILVEFFVHARRASGYDLPII